MKRFAVLLAAVAATALAACHINLIPETGYTEPGIFDLASPSPVTGLPFVVEVETFSNECSGRFKMIFREDENRISVDEYNRWSMPPAAMLTKYLSARFATAPGASGEQPKPVFSLDGSVLTCELNTQTKEVTLMVHYSITEPPEDTFKISGTRSYSVPVPDDTAESFASGMNKAAELFADDLVKLLGAELKSRAAQ